MVSNINEVKLGVIGCGKMASAILKGVVNNGFLKNDNIFLYDTNRDNLNALADKLNLGALFSLDELLSKTNVILIAIKPFGIDSLLNEIKDGCSNKLIMSILAGVKLEKYKKYLPKGQIVRIMPNTPALVNEAMSAVCALDDIDSANFDFAFKFMGNCGKVIKTTEDKIDIITALSGSGPAFYFKIIELLAKSASKLGLDYKQALLLSTQTALGSAKMIFENNFDIDTLIKNVTTPGGCTEVGNNVLSGSDIENIFDKTIKDTMQKAIDLG